MMMSRDEEEVVGIFLSFGSSFHLLGRDFVLFSGSFIISEAYLMGLLKKFYELTNWVVNPGLIS